MTDGSLALRLQPKLVSGTFHWARFVTQYRITLYNDTVEGVGVRLRSSALMYESGDTLWPLIGCVFRVDRHIALAKLQSPTVRWSYFGDESKPMYLGGPVSMINHACRQHSNVVLKVLDRDDMDAQIQRYPCKTIVAVAETRISPKDRIYACYDYNADDLFASRGIACQLCKVDE